MKYFLATFVSVLFAAKAVFSFKDPSMQHRFEQNLSSYRCLVCQNESLQDSQAPLAQDLRQQIYLMQLHGKTDLEIRTIMVSRYGNFIMLSPPVNSHTWLLWLLPMSLLLFWVIWANRER